MKFFVLAVLALAAGTAHAQFKCTTPAGVTFQDAPCSSAATSARVGPKPTPPAAKPWISPDRPNHIKRAFEQGAVVVGMTWDEVFRLNNSQIPDRVNTTTTAAGRTEQQIYRRSNRTIYVYVTNDIVTAVQTTEH